jgi:hypothetical protein
MTRRAPARSATISMKAATRVLSKTPLAPARTGTLQLTRSSVPPLWPDLPRPSMAGFDLSTEAWTPKQAHSGQSVKAVFSRI